METTVIHAVVGRIYFARGMYTDGIETGGTCREFDADIQPNKAHTQLKGGWVAVVDKRVESCWGSSNQVIIITMPKILSLSQNIFYKECLLQLTFKRFYQ
jgi:hypothetical protein